MQMERDHDEDQSEQRSARGAQRDAEVVPGIWMLFIGLGIEERER